MARAHEIWAAARLEGRVQRRPEGVFLLGHDVVKAALRDAQHLSSHGHFEGSHAAAARERLDARHLEAYREIQALESLFVSRTDGAQHDRLRNVARRAFTPRRIAELGEAVAGYTEQLLDALEGREIIDIVADFSHVLPLLVIADLLGVSHDERVAIHDWSSRIGRNRPGAPPEVILDAHEAIVEFRAFVHAVIESKRDAEPESDLVAALMDAREGQRLTEDELVAMFVVLLFAGHETTANLITIGLLEMHRQPDQWAMLCERPEAVARTGVEELLRHSSPIQYLLRVAVAPVTIEGVTIEPGESVFLCLAAANRDPAVFAEPDRLRLDRPEAKEHLTLGFGPHFCLGNALARLEGAAAVSALARRFPNMDVDLEAGLWGGNTMQRALRSLPVALEGRA
jgi:cytochrome P450